MIIDVYQCGDIRGLGLGTTAGGAVDLGGRGG